MLSSPEYLSLTPRASPSPGGRRRLSGGAGVYGEKRRIPEAVEPIGQQEEGLLQRRRAFRMAPDSPKRGALCFLRSVRAISTARL